VISAVIARLRGITPGLKSDCRSRSERSVRFCRVKAVFAKNAFSSSDGSLVL
jgi:hypothetical protein